MGWNDDRVAMMREGMRAQGLDALLCALPSNVLMLSGYFPVVGTAVAVATAAGQVAVLAPNDEQELAERGFADRVQTFESGSLERVETALDALPGPLAKMMTSLGLIAARIGLEEGQWHQTASYAGMNYYGSSLRAMLAQIAPSTQVVNSDAQLRELRGNKTPVEIERIRESCRAAARGFAAGAAALRPGIDEAEAASAFRKPLYVTQPGKLDRGRADGFVHCMSGPNAASAYGTYARSRGRCIGEREWVVTHCNSYVDGYWTDITRTFCTGLPDSRQKEMFQAILAARHAALARIRPGVAASEVDEAARRVLKEHRFGKAFKHPTGHGVGFAAIDHNALPRPHPRSPDVLREGMVFNVEPGIYLQDQGMRHCDMVAVTRDGYELLTPFQQDAQSLLVAGHARP